MRLIILISILALLVACSKNIEQPTLSDDEFVEILIDVHLAQVKVDEYQWKLRDDLRFKFFKKIAELHHMTSDELEVQINLMQGKPKHAKIIYDRLSERLKELEKEYTKLEKRKI